MYKKITLVVLVILLDFLCLQYRSFAWTRFFDFEGGQEGSHAQGEFGFDEAGARTFFSSERSYRGTLSCKMEWQEGNSGFPLCMGNIHFPTLVTAGENIWFGGYFYFEEPWSWQCNPRVKILRIHVRHNDGTHGGYLSILANGDGNIVLSNEVAGYEPYSNVYLAPGEWQYLEFYVHLSSQEPIFRIWRNGNLVFEDREHVTLKEESDISDFALVMSYWNGGPSMDMDEFIDDVTVTTDMPSNVDRNGNRMIFGLCSDEDVNQDGLVNIQDVQLIVNVILGSVTNSRADVNGNGTTNVSDVQSVVNKIMG